MLAFDLIFNAVVTSLKFCYDIFQYNVLFLKTWWPVSAYTQTYVSCTKVCKFYINKKYSTASDVWSFGALMYEIWSLGHKPFEGKTNHVEM